MKYIGFLALGALLPSASALALRGDDPTPTTPSWVTPTVTLPSPYGSPSMYVTADSAGSCRATLCVYHSPNCKLQTTVYPSTTTVAFGVDCMGCSQLSVSLRAGPCGMGGHHTKYPDTTMATPSTKWSFVCAPTPAPAGPLSAA